MKRVLAAVIASATAVSVGVLAPAAHADDFQFMKSQLLQQNVLRVQMPTTLGAWEQYLYFDETGARFTRPTLCFGEKGEIKLPRAKVVGAVNYQVNQFTNGSVSIYQYANQAAADRALAALRAAKCGGEPRVPTEGEATVKGDQGFDQTDASETGLSATVTFRDGDLRGYINTHTTQRGLAIVQTQVRKFEKVPQTVKQQQVEFSKVSSFNQKWHPKVVKSYESFGQGNPR